MNIHLLGNGTLSSAIWAGYSLNGTKKHEFVESVEEADLVWCAYDVRIDEHQRGHPEDVIETLSEILLRVSRAMLVIVSSQLPVGTCSYLEAVHPRHTFIVVPENVRASHNIQDWMHQDRVIIGVRSDHNNEWLRQLFAPFTDTFLFMSPESAEMVKHALNGFLACSIAYINEIAHVCSLVGADAHEVADGLMSDHRIGTQAYLHPGAPYDRGNTGTSHLAREVNTLIALGDGLVPLINAIKESNAVAQWEHTP